MFSKEIEFTLVRTNKSKHDSLSTQHKKSEEMLCDSQDIL